MNFNILKNQFLLLIIVNFFLGFHIFAQEKSLDELLDLDISELVNIQVLSASKTLQRIDDVPATVRVITSEQIKANGYFTFEEALADLPGFQFRNIMGLNSYVFQRGVPSQNNLILLLIDGIQINELNSGGFYGGGQYNLDNIECIEVVYGPASALYGTNAVSGIINLITKNASDYKGLSAGALYGSFNTFSMNASYGYYNEENRAGMHLSGMYKTTEKADLRGVKGDNNWSNDMENFEDDYAFNLKLDYKGFNAGIDYINRRSSATTYYKSIGTEYKDKGTLWNIRFINAYLKHHYDFSKKWQLSSQLYLRDTEVMDNSIQIINDTTQIGYYRPNSLFGFESLINYKPGGRLDMLGGIVYEGEQLADDYSNTYSASADEKPPVPNPPPMENNQLFSAYLQARYLIQKPLSITLGGRFDVSSVYNNVFTPRLGLVYHKNRFTSKLLYMRAYRAPKPWDYNDGAGNQNLDPEEIKSFEWSMVYNITSKIRLDISLYRNILTKIINRQDVNQSWHWVNQGRVNTDGMETELEYRAGKIEAYLNYTYNNSYNEADQQIAEIAKHTANAGLTYSRNKNFKINLRGNYLGKRKNPLPCLLYTSPSPRD